MITAAAEGDRVAKSKDVCMEACGNDYLGGDGNTWDSGKPRRDAGCSQNSATADL